MSECLDLVSLYGVIQGLNREGGLNLNKTLNAALFTKLGLCVCERIKIEILV